MYNLNIFNPEELSRHSIIRKARLLKHVFSIDDKKGYINIKYNVQ